MAGKGRVRLKKGETSIEEILLLSKEKYKGEVDNKRKRSIIDVISGKVTARNNLTYNKSEKKWEQTGRNVKLEFIVRSKPVSYKKQDTVNTHKYPVTILIHDWFKGFKSPFRWRTGGLSKWKKAKFKLREAKDEKQKDKWREANLKITNLNIKRGLQGSFIFENMWILQKYDLLFGPLTCKNEPPKITNPKFIPYFDKTSYFVVTQILPRLFNNEKIGKLLQKTHK